MTPFFSTAAILIISFFFGLRSTRGYFPKAPSGGETASQNFLRRLPLKAKKEDSVNTAHQITLAPRRSIVTHRAGRPSSYRRSQQRYDIVQASPALQAGAGYAERLTR